MSQSTDRQNAGQQNPDRQSPEPQSPEPQSTDRHDRSARTNPRGVSGLFSGGRLVTIPRKAARREELLAHLAETLFAPDRAYSEPEVNDALRTVHEDCSALRRYLITSGHLTRTRDGSSYRRATTTR